MGPTFVTTRRPPTSKVTTQAEPTFAPTAGARSGDHTQAWRVCSIPDSFSARSEAVRALLSMVGVLMGVCPSWAGPGLGPAAGVAVGMRAAVSLLAWSAPGGSDQASSDTAAL